MSNRDSFLAIPDHGLRFIESGEIIHNIVVSYAWLKSGTGIPFKGSNLMYRILPNNAVASFMNVLIKS